MKAVHQNLFILALKRGINAHKVYGNKNIEGVGLMCFFTATLFSNWSGYQPTGYGVSGSGFKGGNAYHPRTRSNFPRHSH